MFKRKPKEPKQNKSIDKEEIKNRWYNYKEERALAREGKTKKSRFSEMERYRLIEHRLNLAIIAVTLALIIVLLFTFFI